MTTANSLSSFDQTASLLQAISSPQRLQIILTIGRGEACVCHLEAILGYRQAYISQHLMALRQADLLESRREGKYIFYRLRDPKLLEVIFKVTEITGETLKFIQINQETQCGCPHCSSEAG